MIKKLVRVLSIVINLVGSFGVVYFIIAFLIKRGIENVFTGSTIAVTGPGVVLLGCIAYTGTWISIAEKNRKQFVWSFIIFNLCPGILGGVIAFIGIRP